MGGGARIRGSHTMIGSEGVDLFPSTGAVVKMVIFGSNLPLKQFPFP